PATARRPVWVYGVPMHAALHIPKAVDHARRRAPCAPQLEQPAVASRLSYPFLHFGVGSVFQGSLRYSVANSVTSIAWFTSRSRKTWVVLLVGHVISRSATLVALARPKCCSSGLPPKLLPEVTCR